MTITAIRKFAPFTLYILFLHVSLPVLPATAQADVVVSAELSEADRLVDSDEASIFEAIKIYRAAANAGNPYGMLQLGILYETGKGVPIDMDEAATFYRLASELGNYEAMDRLGLFFRSGTSVNKNLETARSYFTRAANAGVPAAMLHLAEFYIAEKRYDRAIEWLEKGAAAGNSAALVQLGDIYRHGLGGTTDHERAVAYYRDAADGNEAAAFMALGELYAAGLGVQQDADTARSLFEQAAKLGLDDASFKLGQTLLDAGEIKAAIAQFQAAANNSDALITLGDIYRQKKYGVQDLAKAEEYYASVLPADTPGALYGLGMLYSEGVDGKPDAERGAKLFQRAAEVGHAPAMVALGRYHELTTKDYAQAVTLYERATEQNLAEAYSALGALHANGNGVDKDEARAVELFRQGIEIGDSTSLYWLALMIERGEGVPAPDLAEAERLFAAFAQAESDTGMKAMARFLLRHDRADEGIALYESMLDAGDAEAGYSLGALYYFGQYIEKDPEQSRLYFERTAELGYSLAMDALGIIHRDGFGVEADPEMAISWFTRAAETGYTASLTSIAKLYIVLENTEQAISYYQQAGEAGDVSAYSALAEIYETGKGVEADLGKAVDYYLLSADAGHAASLTQAAKRLFAGTDESRYGMAMKLALRAAEAGDGYAMFLVGDAYEEGYGVEKNDETAFSWFMKGAEAKDATATANVAGGYMLGLGVAKDHKTGVMWDTRAAELGYPNSLYNLGDRYVRGIDDVVREPAKGADYIYKALTLGSNFAAQYYPTYRNSNMPQAFRMRMQQLLKRDGFYSGAIDADFGPGTRAALKAAFGSAVPSSDK